MANRSRILSLAFGCLMVAGACGSVSPSSTGDDGGAGHGGAGDGGSTGGGGTTGTGGMTGAAGTGAAGTGAAGNSGRVPAKHRATAAACPAPTSSCALAVTAGARAASGAATPGAAAPLPPCASDTDCTAAANGRCVGVGTCACVYDTCSSDSDCAQMGGPCICASTGQSIVAPTGGAANVCKAGNCRVDGDCGANGYCSPSLGTCGNYGGVTGYYCHTPKDKCTDAADCASQGGGDCRFDAATSVWDCETSECVG